MAKFVKELPIYANAILPYQSRQKKDYPELDKNETAAFPEGKGQLLILADEKGKTVVFNKVALFCSISHENGSLKFFRPKPSSNSIASIACKLT